MVHVCIVSDCRMNMRSFLLTLYPWRWAWRDVVPRPPPIPLRSVCVHWTLREASIFSCARNSEIIAAVLVSSWMVRDWVSLGVQKSRFANFDVVVAGNEGFWFQWWVPSDLVQTWRDRLRVNGVIVEWLSGMCLLCVSPCCGWSNWNHFEMVLSVILCGFLGLWLWREINCDSQGMIAPAKQYLWEGIFSGPCCNWADR